jgi:putative oxidoreductase
MEKFQRMLHTSAPASTILIRIIVGGVFLSEGIQKFLFPEALGAGRFLKIGIPFPQIMAPFDGVFEIGCGVFLILGLLTRLATIPMIINMIVAIGSTKVPMLLEQGFWKMAHEARTDFSMILGCVFLLIVGAGPVSIDAPVSNRSSQIQGIRIRSQGKITRGS